MLYQVIVEVDDSPVVTTSGDDDRPVDRVQGDASPGARQGLCGDVLRGPGRMSVPVDVQEGSSVLRALTNRAGRSDAVLDRGVHTGLGQVEFPDDGDGGDAQEAQGSSCLGGG